MKVLATTRPSTASARWGRCVFQQHASTASSFFATSNGPLQTALCRPSGFHPLADDRQARVGCDRFSVLGRIHVSPILANQADLRRVLIHRVRAARRQLAMNLKTSSAARKVSGGHCLAKRVWKWNPPSERISVVCVCMMVQLRTG